MTERDLPSPDECEVRQATEVERFEMYERCRVHFAPNVASDRFTEYMRMKVASPSYSDRARSWVLVKRGDPKSPVYSHVETLHRDGWAKDEDGMRDASIYGIVFVVTPPDFRRKGYSQRLLRMLHYLLAPTQNIGEYPSTWAPLPKRPKENFPPADMSYLSSVAPPGFYEQCLIGPEADKREGWISHQAENPEITWDLNKDTEEGSGPKAEYRVVYRKDIEGLAEQIAEAHKAILANTPVSPGETVVRVIPSSPEGVLLFTDLHWLTAGSVRPGPYDDNAPLGIRLVSADNSKADDSFTSSQPLVLFMPEAWKAGEVVITMMLNVDDKNLPAAINAVREVVSQGDRPCTQARVWGIDKGEAVADALIAHHGAQLSYRNETNTLPAGMAWYGPKGTTLRFQGNEAWAFL